MRKVCYRYSINSEGVSGPIKDGRINFILQSSSTKDVLVQCAGLIPSIQDLVECAKDLDQLQSQHA